MSYGLSTLLQHCPPIKESVRGLQTSSDHPPYPGFKLHYPGKETECDSGTMPDCLCGLVKMIVGSLPIEDPNTQQRQQGVVNLCPIDHMEPFSPLDHMGPQPIIEVQVQEDVIPPAMMGSCLILPVLANSMEGILGNLRILLVSISTSRNKEKNYLECHWIMSPSRQRGILFIAESSNFTQKPTSGQRDRWSGPLPEGCSLDDWMLEQRHRWSSACLRWVKVS